jgi:hypothetical protein
MVKENNKTCEQCRWLDRKVCRWLREIVKKDSPACQHFSKEETHVKK